MAGFVDLFPPAFGVALREFNFQIFADVDSADAFAAQMLDGYRSKSFTPRDVLDEVIAALETTDSLCNVMATDMFKSARIDADRATDRGVSTRRWQCAG